jgi:ankyrin repeat protein
MEGMEYILSLLLFFGAALADQLTERPVDVSRPEDAEKLLAEAILRGREDTVTSILSAPDKPGKVVLNYALLKACRVLKQTTDKHAHEASGAIVTLLLKSGADPNFIPERGKARGAPLLEAVYAGNTPAVKLLLAAGADPKRAVNVNGGSLLALSLQQDDPEIVALLWPRYQPLSDDLRKELTSVAGSHGKAESVRRLVSLGFKMSGGPKESAEALYRAVERNDLATVGVLLDQGANPNEPVWGSRNILAQAIRVGNIDIVRRLVASGAEINVVTANPGQETPLRAAVGSVNVEIFHFLKEHGAKLKPLKPEDSLLHALPWYKGYYGKTSEESYASAVLMIFDELLKVGNPVDAPDFQGQSLLARAAAQGFPKLLQKAIAEHANVNFLPEKCKSVKPTKRPVEPAAQPGDGGARKDVDEAPRAFSEQEMLASVCASPLHFAIRADNLENAQILIGAKANVNSPASSDGLTPLMAAAIVGNPEMVSLMLKSGADSRAKNFAGQTAAEIAKIRENTRAQSLIEPKAK